MNTVPANKLAFQVAKSNPFAIPLSYATPGSAAFDLAIPGNMSVGLDPGETKLVDTGWVTQFPPTHALFLLARSGLGAKLKVRLANSIGLIDSDYRGPLIVALTNEGTVRYEADGGTRIAQAVLLPVVQGAFELVSLSELQETTRGEGGFGSTGSTKIVTGGTTPVSLRTTHTLATCEVSDNTFDEVAGLLAMAEYHHAISPEGLDMTGLMLVRKDKS